MGTTRRVGSMTARGTLAGALALLAIVAAPATGAPEDEWVDVMVVHDGPLTGDQARGSSLDKIGVHVERVRESRAKEAKRHWRSQRGVVTVHEAVQYQAAYEPSDPVWPAQYESQQVEVDVAWDTTFGDESIVIAVLDTGLNSSALDFVGRIAPGGHDYVNDDTNPHDDEPGQHGTQVSMVAAAGIDDGLNNAGFCPACKILPMKVLDSNGSGGDPDVAAAIMDASDLGADIINMSLGSTAPSTTLQNAVAYAASQGVTMVAAAGNEGNAVENYPAAFSQVIGVAGVDLPDGGAGGPYPMTGSEPKFGFSNYGSWVSVSGPGCNVTYTKWKGQSPFLFCGTSSATPMVAGTAGLILARRPNLTANKHREIIEVATLDVVPDVDGTPVAEHGRVSPPRALQACTSDPTVVSPFKDVHGGNPFCVHITWMVDTGITSGCNKLGDRYCPNANVTRASMSVFMAKLANAPTTSCSTAPFNDVDKDSRFCPSIKWMAESGITTGCGDGNFCPNDAVHRQEMSAFMAKLADATTTACTTAPFNDVPASSRFCPSITWVANNGITAGCGGGRFCPGDPVTRGQMSVFMFKLDPLLA